MKIFEIYFSDLTESARRRYLQFMEVEDPSELNVDISPLCIIDKEDENGTE